MRIIKSFCIAFSMYSKIPMPQFEWKNDDMKYSMCFFPCIGLVIAALEYLWLLICFYFGLSHICELFISIALPIIVTGGIHIDGFMDTMDAFNSYQSQEKKLDILKDSHIGAFSVITLVAYYLVYIAAVSQVNTVEGFKIFCLGFVLSRILSAIAVVSFQAAKQEGTLYKFASTAHSIVVKTFLYIEFVVCIVVMSFISLKITAIVVTISIIIYLYYWVKTKKELGGITGDTAGYFLSICECAVAIGIAIATVL